MCLTWAYCAHMKRLHVFIPEQQIEGLAALSKKTGLKTSEHIRRALDDYLSKNLVVEEERNKSKGEMGGG
jgi:metal-responsive CopG/Arc/MetJ family transcriptional regulator